MAIANDRQVIHTANAMSLDDEIKVDADIWNRAFYDDGEWVSWSDVEEQLQCQEWRAKYPNAIRHLIPYFQDLLALAESYHLQTGRHLDVY
ncbi:hypothetical protein [Rhizobium leguminosarum]|uniref:hypothetical protein n=1 Tax=Rhizobium leguminosarum TaxID=384 RepID=UPI0024A99CF6|nr:hypothetical protein [Rhizobium leguminosarum]MDI5930216.1 hypothetical protein [Rhizobium leguminosarum]